MQKTVSSGKHLRCSRLLNGWAAGSRLYQLLSRAPNTTKGVTEYRHRAFDGRCRDFERCSPTSLKGVCSRMLRQERPDLAARYWKGVYWPTVGNPAPCVCAGVVRHWCGVESCEELQQKSPPHGSEAAIRRPSRDWPEVGCKLNCSAPQRLEKESS
jgi:hypothetical protein